MKKRIFYIISFLVIFCIEVLIALYVCDNFVRPYIGDVLVVVLVYSFVRIFLLIIFHLNLMSVYFCQRGFRECRSMYFFLPAL